MSGAQRQRVIDALCEHYAEDHLELQEFESRLDRAHRAGVRDELDELLADLPRLGTSPARRDASGEDKPSPLPSAEGTMTSVPPGAGRVPASRVPASQFEFAFWSGRQRSGSWVPARTIRAVACMGGVELDFREALFGPEEIRIHVAALMGGVEIIVPPGVHVDAGGFALLGGFEEKLAGGGPLPPNAPTLRITGFAVMGGVEVVSRLPGESAREARRRLKEESRRRLEDGRQKRRKR